MVEVGLFDVEVDLWQLLSEFRVVLPTVTISQAKVILEKNAEGSANWEFRAASAVTEPVPGKAYRVSGDRKTHHQGRHIPVCQSGN